jgi:hypothetical protein
MDTCIDPEFRSLIPPLTPEEYAGLEKNNLGFGGFGSVNEMKYLEILPSTMGNRYWFVVLSDLTLQIQDYTKRPIAASRIKSTVNFVDWNEGYELTPGGYSPLPIDFFDAEYQPITARGLTNIYFIQSVVGGPIKIGTAYDIQGRLQQHQTGSPFLLQVIKTIENVPRKTERELHRRFDAYRLHGEWFKDEILNLIEGE